MGKLSDMVSEDLSFTEKLKINLRKVGLAGVGLASIVDSERVKLYRQITELGEAYGGADTVVGRISLLGTGTVSFVLEESQRLFDELVEEGEQALKREKSAELKPTLRKIDQRRPVAKSKAPASPLLKQVEPKPKMEAQVGELEPVNAALLHRLQQTEQKLQSAELSQQQRLDVKALTCQIKNGDVTGRRPAKTKPKEQAEYDARRLLKGMKAEEAIKRLETLAQRLSTSAIS